MSWLVIPITIKVTSLSNNQHILIDNLVVRIFMCNRVWSSNIGEHANLVVSYYAILDDHSIVGPHVETEIHSLPHEERFELKTVVAFDVVLDTM